MVTSPLGFAYEIAKALKNFIGGFEGIVKYDDKNTSNIFIENYPEIDDFDSNLEFKDRLKLKAQISGINHEVMFNKHTDYQVEDEYRLVWITSFEGHDIFLKCPNALRYCKKITSNYRDQIEIKP